jgi:hypothetical protein
VLLGIKYRWGSEFVKGWFLGRNSEQALGLGIKVEMTSN